MLFDSPVITSTVLKQTKNQIYIAPHPLLHDYIAHYTISFPITHPKSFYSGEPKDLTLIPDASGCMIYTYTNGRLSQHLWGPTTKVVQVKDDSSSPIYRFFIEFLPGGLYAMTGISQKELSDGQYTLCEVDKHLSLSLALESSANLDELIAKANDTFLKALQKNSKIHPSISPIITNIKHCKGNISIKHLASTFYISQRQMSRIFESHIGMSAKQFARLVRVNNLVNSSKTHSYTTYSQMAQTFGFFDEAHLIHDFKELCSTTPAAFSKNMSNFYNEPFKY